MGLRGEPGSSGGWKRGRLGTEAKCLHLGQKTADSGFIVVDTSALRDKGVGTRARNIGGKECSREELSVYCEGPVGLMATTDLLGGGASAVAGSGAVVALCLERGARRQLLGGRG